MDLNHFVSMRADNIKIEPLQEEVRKRLLNWNQMTTIWKLMVNPCSLPQRSLTGDPAFEQSQRGYQYLVNEEYILAQSSRETYALFSYYCHNKVAEYHSLYVTSSKEPPLCKKGKFYLYG